MRTWDRTLTVAGVGDPALRDAYTRQRALVSAYRRHAYAAVRLLLPTALVPHVIAATAFMHHTDSLLDESPAGPEGDDGYAAWEKEVRDGLATGESAHPVLRALLHTVGAHPGLRSHVEEFLTGAPLDRHFTGFADEADYQRYVDAYSLPAFMLIACLLLAPDADPGDARALCRAYIDGSQRLDFVNDLADDLRDGRLTLPARDLEHHAVSRTDLEHRRDTPGTRALLHDHLGRARRDLLTSRRLPELAPPAHRSFIRAAIALEVRTAEAAAAKGTGVLRSSARPSLRAALRILVREYGRRGR
ncbi:phytoene/squalene synthetase [Streptomyces eurocidicus]|uniref:Phytoene synthase n=1 Tax=Streptomyces eurocidicus TaxID=66423 RepID=A0A2N8NVB1_STREU|nr:squalene/phytoene synthase family protein [Streptomyces eurocidicus]MBB5122983.1 phytoene synthase [Streptomyces eurocidicus]MBF6056552.1 phytoene/squalene synthetase [Streptomyces eurocidicus]PNE32728.1 phytoene/squalene synthetase [Streptomyces eurocidicus]